MSGNSCSIGICESIINDCVESIICNWDGDPDSAGRILLENYKDKEKIMELIKLGNISILGKNIGTKILFDDKSTLYKNEQCLAYMRDGERSSKENRSNFLSIHNFLRKFDFKHYYLFIVETNNWYYYNRYLIHGKFLLLKDIVNTILRKESIRL